MFCIRKVRGQQRGPLWLDIFGMGGSILMEICSLVFGRLGIIDMITLGHQHDDLLVLYSCNL